MATDTLKIEPRDFDQLLREFHALVPFYTPEWRLDLKEKGSDSAIVKIFIHLLITIYHRLNRLPEKHFIAFLDKIGVKLIPAQPASVPVTFVLSEGAGEHVLIPERTQVAAGDTIFETEKNLLASPARLVDIFHTHGQEDTVFQAPPNIISGTPVPSVETRLLYPAGLGDQDIFIDSTEQLLENDIVSIGKSADTIEYGIVSAISENRVTLVYPLENGEFERLVQPPEKEEPVYFSLPTIAIYGVGKTFSDRLKKKGIDTIKQLLEYRGKVKEVSEILSIGGPRNPKFYLEQAENILENAEKSVLDRAYRTLIPTGEGKSLPPQSIRYYETGTPVKKVTGLELFKGKNLQEHVLYLGHDELFNIDGVVLIILRVQLPEWASMLSDSGAVQWEYWGEAVERRSAGQDENPGWHPLEVRPGKSSTGEFYLRKYFSGEIAPYVLNDIESCWIRCRIQDINGTTNIEIKNIQLRIVDIRFLELPTEAIRGIEEAFAAGLADNDIHTVEQLLEYKDRAADVAEMIRGEKDIPTYYQKMAENFLLNAVKLLLDEEYEEKLFVAESPSEILPDMAFFNDLAFDLTPAAGLYFKTPFYPFGKRPLTGNTFYISCSEFFSKPNIAISIHFEFSPLGFSPPETADPDGVELYWEYWDGEMWNIFKNLVDNTEKFTIDGDVVFTNPNNTTPISVNGKENYWIRVRIVSGDYGREEYIKVTGDVYQIDYSNILPPLITRLTLSTAYTLEPEFFPFQHYLVTNNLESIDRLKEFRDPGKAVKPFISLEEKRRCIYLAFDRKLEKGPIALFFAIDEKPVSPDQVPIIRWQYYNEKQQWEKISGIDSTMSLTRTGVIEFVFPLDSSQTRRFGVSAYWVRAVYEDETASGSRDMVIPPITGVFLNTTPAVQCETFSNETVGSGSGSPDQVFSLTNVPVVSGSEEIWIDEFKTISAEEQERLREEGLYPVDAVTDAKGNATGFRVQWKRVESIVCASAEDRGYEIDYVSGQIVFGDGIHGKIPPTGADNITANYRCGGGREGNLAAFLVKDLKTSLPFMDRAFNPLAAGGGTGTETIEGLLRRGPGVLKHRNRAVTLDDFERLAFQSAGGIARVRCLPNMNDRREYCDGWVTVIVIPRTEEERPRLSLQLKRNVEGYLRYRAAYSLVEADFLRVIGPVYVDVSVEVGVVVSTVEDVPVVEVSCISRLREFLNPLTGGYEGRGWAFGRVPCFSDFYALLEKIEGVDHVVSLSIALSIPEPGDTGEVSEYLLTPENPVGFDMPSYAVVCSGKHKINVSI